MTAEEKKAKRKAYMVEYMKRYMAKNRTQLLQYKHDWYERNKAHVKEMQRAYKENNKEQLSAYYKERVQKTVRELPDWYVAQGITQRTRLKNRDIPQNLITAKRIQMQINREITNAKRNRTA